MTMVQTMGTASCATLSIGFFKRRNPETGLDQITLNEKYKENGEFTPPETGMSIKDWRNRILWPTIQDEGRTYDYPFTRMMEEIDKSDLQPKMIAATLNVSQYEGNDGYWRKELEKWGFKTFMKIPNKWGQDNYVMFRNYGEVLLNEE